MEVGRSEELRRSPERRAWAVLLFSLFACCAITVGVPTAALSFINTASDPPATFVQLQAGIVSTFGAGEQESVDARVVDLKGRPLGEGSTIVVGNDLDSVAGLSIRPQNGAGQITLQLYSGTRLRLEKLRVRRFDLSVSGDAYILRLDRGRIEIQVDYPAARALSLSLVTPHAVSTITARGEYAVAVDEQRTRFTGYVGQAQVLVNSQLTMGLNAGERLDVVRDATTMTPVRMLAAENLVRNPIFQHSLEPANWFVSASASVGAPLGQFTLVDEGDNQNGGRQLDLNRAGDGLGPGRTSITQTVNQDVTNHRLVQVRVAFSIISQEIPVCGGTGSECPLMIDVLYARSDGSEGHWRQGFYADGVPVLGELPDWVVKERQSKHIFKPLDQPAFFASENLLRLVPDMSVIQSITLYAEGHAVHTRIQSVELWVQE